MSERDLSYKICKCLLGKVYLRIYSLLGIHKSKSKKVVGSVFLSYLKCKWKGIITLNLIENLIFLIYFSMFFVKLIKYLLI